MKGRTMNPLIQPKKAIPLFLVALACFALLPAAQALLPPPPPDGGYPNGNTAEGDNALFFLTTGVNNTAIGAQALLSNTTGDRNTAIGFQALLRNTAGSNIRGGNTAIGFRALYHHVGVGYGSTAIGDSALFSNTTGGANTATGFQALYNNTTGYNNTANGVSAMVLNTTGLRNTAIGTNALFFNNSGSFNTAIGNDALYSNTTGGSNSAIGDDALYSNTTGDANSANGFFALYSNTTGRANSANGFFALFSNTTGHNNTADGFHTLRHNTTGSFNIAVGNSAGDNLTIGSNNIDIGNVGVAGESGTVRIGTAGTHTATFIAGISGATVINGVQVMVNPNGKLGTMPSSARFKEVIKPMDKASEAILALKPVTFRYKKEIDPKAPLQFGLVAEEVEKVNPDLVAHDDQGKVYTVRYEAVNAMLLNEFLKEHRTVQEQQKEIEALKAELKEQRALIRKVSDKVEFNKPVPQMVVNNQ
jgi:hypothetical protein